MVNVIVKICVFQNKKSKKYKRLTLESESGQSDRFLYESGDTDQQPSRTPSSGEGTPGKLPDYEARKAGIVSEGYDIVTEL